MAAMDTDEPPSLAQALQAVQRLFPEAQDARRWAEERGYDWEPDDSLLTQFLQGEANCETLRLAKEHRKGAQERATVHARANALAAELGCTETLATEDALTFCEKVVEEKGAATLTANPTPRSADELKKLELIHAALKSDFVKSCGVGHGLILVVHGEEMIDHEEDLTSRDIAFRFLPLLRLRLFHVLT